MASGLKAFSDAVKTAAKVIANPRTSATIALNASRNAELLASLARGGGVATQPRSTYQAPAASYTASYGGGGGGGGGVSYSRGGGYGGGGGGGGATYVAPVVDSLMANGPYANKYLESAADLFAKNPEILLSDIVQRYAGSDGMGDNAIYAQLEPYMDSMNQLFMAMNGQDAAVQGSKESWVNWLGQQIDNMLTPGKYTDVNSAIGNIFAPAENSPLRAFLAEGTAQQQANNTRALLEASLGMGYHPLIARAAASRLDEAERQYLAASAKGAVDPFYQYLQQTMPQLARMFPGAV